MSQGYDAFFKKAKMNTGKSEAVQPNRLKRKNLKESAVTEAELRKAFRLKPEPAAKSSKKSKGGSKADLPVAAFLCLGIIVSTFGWYIMEPESFWSIVDRVEIQVMGQASAQAGAAAANPAQTKETSEEKSAAAARAQTAGTESKPGNWTAEDISYFGKLNERKQQLDLREQELNVLEEELHKQKAELESRIKELNGVRDQIAGLLKTRVDMDQERVDRLVELYSSMKPKQASEILGSLNEDLAVEILGKMKKKNAAEIMNLLAPAKAQALSEMFAGYQQK